VGAVVWGEVMWGRCADGLTFVNFCYLWLLDLSGGMFHVKQWGFFGAMTEIGAEAIDVSRETLMGVMARDGFCLF
jgi:hypothetical protein